MLMKMLNNHAILLILYVRVVSSIWEDKVVDQMLLATQVLEANSSLMECAMIRLWIFVTVGLKVISKANNNHIKIRDDNYDDLDDDDDYLKGVLDLGLFS